MQLRRRVECVMFGGLREAPVVSYRAPEAVSPGPGGGACRASRPAICCATGDKFDFNPEHLLLSPSKLSAANFGWRAYCEPLIAKRDARRLLSARRGLLVTLGDNGPHEAAKTGFRRVCAAAERVAVALCLRGIGRLCDAEGEAKERGRPARANAITSTRDLALSYCFYART